MLFCATVTGKSAFESPNCGLADKLIANLADHIENEKHVKILGQKLGFPEDDIKGYLAINRFGGRVTSRGTRAMLFEWRQRVKPSSQHVAIDTALREAGLIFLAEKYMKITDIPTGAIWVALYVGVMTIVVFFFSFRVSVILFILVSIIQCV